ncbi:NAD(P)/FAD-dependent oxidoreductase [Thermosipho atlanticus]|uniref:Thioredoxin reductase n=1 Tax=Thermosipho atlanticus DSM 15807 TaxID=1123380 RepID=A0A1M5SFK1_9BACT|nr:NAD(P)/FAD-dependent oxidoreductase [Thermosipho atlanticus]SHH37210.1 Thioredoxin reductase [Thermosipho atlanticus DSM 15807]
MRVGVVGGGPGGIATAVFLKRYGIDVIIFEKKELGGLLNNAWRVENIPLIKPSSGSEIVSLMKRYVKLYEIDVIYDEVIEIRSNFVKTKDKIYHFEYIVVAIGTEPKRIEAFETERTYYELRDLPQNVKKLAIYGAGDVAFDEAISSKLKGIDVHIFNRSNKIRALKRLINIANALKIPYHPSEPILSVDYTNANIVIKTSKGEYKFDALLIAIGRKINLEILKTEKVFLVGDVAHPHYRQASIAVGDGIRAAMEIIQGRY